MAFFMRRSLVLRPTSREALIGWRFGSPQLDRFDQRQLSDGGMQPSFERLAIATNTIAASIDATWINLSARPVVICIAPSQPEVNSSR